MFNLGADKTELVDFQNPFSKGSIAQVMIIIKPALFNEAKIEYKAWIKFKAGNTDGEQKIEEQDFDSLVIKVKAFIAAL